MKAVFISYNQAFHDEILDLMNKSGINGFTNWELVTGRGSRGGEPHLGDHAWPTLNSSVLSVVDDATSVNFMNRLKNLDENNPLMGLRAFTWNIESTI
ncbi:MAG: hypothetical protein RSC28_00620 [Bacteroidales bacterium]